MRMGVALGVGLVCLACVGVAAANQPPLASAGLDQEARANTTVYLDAGGSLDPDGSIASYEWTIVRPDGNTTTPDCETCAQTWFVPREVGRYNVTATVTDEAGATQSDTLYVAVSAPLRLPSSPASGGGGTGIGGSYSGSGGEFGTWNAIVNDGEDLILSTARGSDFVIDTPVGQVRIDESVLDRVREPDGDVPFENVVDYFHAVGLSEENIRDATSRSLAEGNTCQSTRGACTTNIPDNEENTEDARRNLGLYSEYEPDSPSESTEVSETTNRESIKGSISSVTSAIGSLIGSDSNGEPDSSENDDADHSVSHNPISNVVNHIAGDSDSGSTDSESNDEGGSSNYDDGYGSPVP